MIPPLPPVIPLLFVNPVVIIGLILLFVGTMVAMSLRWHEKASVRRHRRNRNTAARLLTKLPTLAGDAQRLSYLRRINPYVFEELLLLAMERQGLKVVRNASYSGDGGLDGQVFIDGRRWLIQAKRYSRAVDPAHVEAFAALLVRHRCGGLFIHTGRTGAKSKQLVNANPNSIYPLHIISGKQLLALLAGDPGWINSKGKKYENFY